jgi:hypothetical protein
VKVSEKNLPGWFLNHMGQRYDPLPEIKIWLAPENESRRSEERSFLD